jgi:hypothetical protein
MESCTEENGSEKENRKGSAKKKGEKNSGKAISYLSYGVKMRLGES